MASREEWIEQIKEKIDEANAEIDRLRAKAESASSDARKQYDEYLVELRGQRADAEKRLKELRDSSEAALEDLKKGTESAWGSIKKAISDARDKF